MKPLYKRDKTETKKTTRKKFSWKREKREETPLIKPIYECDKRESFNKLMDIIFIILPIIPFILFVIGIQNIYLIALVVLIAMASVFVQPFLSAGETAISPITIANILSEEALLTEWSCFGFTLPFVGRLENSLIMVVFTERLGIRTTIILLRESSSIPLPLSPNAKPKYKLKRNIKLVRRDLQEGEILDYITGKIGIFEGEVIFPSVKNKTQLLIYRGKVIIAQVYSGLSRENLKKLTKFLLEELMEATPVMEVRRERRGKLFFKPTERKTKYNSIKKRKRLFWKKEKS